MRQINYRAHVTGYILVACFLMAVKLWLISRYGNATPYWDQWDAEALALYTPWFEGNLRFSDLFAAHNEHRILTTRLLDLLLLELNDKVWNPILQMQVNAALHVASICLLLFYTGRIVSDKMRPVLFVLSALIFSIPFGWENTLAGFQSQFYFLLLFSFIFLWSMSTHRTYSTPWFCGLLAGVLCIFSLASGALTILAGAVILAFRKFQNRIDSGVAISAILLLASIAALSIYFTPSPPAHIALKAHTIGQLLHSIGAILSWPGRRLGVGLLVIHAPLCIFIVSVLRDTSQRTAGHYFVVALGIWVFGQFLSIAYGRAGGDLASRYADIFAIGLIANLVSLLTLTNLSGLRKFAFWGPLLWLTLVTYELDQQMSRASGNMQKKHDISVVQERNVRNYLCTGDASNIQKKPLFSTPYPDSFRLQLLLDSPLIRPILPGNIYEPNAKNPHLPKGKPFCAQ